MTILKNTQKSIRILENSAKIVEKTLENYIENPWRLQILLNFQISACHKVMTHIFRRKFLTNNSERSTVFRLNYLID